MSESFYNEKVTNGKFLHFVCCLLFNYYHEIRYCTHNKLRDNVNLRLVIAEVHKVTITNWSVISDSYILCVHLHKCLLNVSFLPITFLKAFVSRKSHNCYNNKTSITNKIADILIFLYNLHIWWVPAFIFNHLRLAWRETYVQLDIQYFMSLKTSVNFVLLCCLRHS